MTDSAKALASRESSASWSSILLEQAGAVASDDQGESVEPSGEPLPSRRSQPDGKASCVEEVDGTWGLAESGLGEQGPTLSPRRPPQGPPASGPSQDFSFIEVSVEARLGRGGQEAGAGA